MRLDESGDFESVEVVLAHAKNEGFGASLGEPGIVGTGYGACCVLEEPQLVSECANLGGGGGGEDEGAHEDIRVPADVFVERVEDDVGAEQ
jgi:hypothetical protein